MKARLYFRSARDEDEFGKPLRFRERPRPRPRLFTTEDDGDEGEESWTAEAAATPTEQAGTPGEQQSEPSL